MTTYPAIDALELEIRAGRGVAIIVEGNSYEEDPWFYGQWFSDRARDITFFPQNGWDRVVSAVDELRGRCPGFPIYGIIDRDFAGDASLDADFGAHGILRTPRYTLENYLLDPGCWAAVLGFIFRRRPDASRGWHEVAQVQAHLEQCFRDCLPLAAHNRVIKLGCDQYPDQAAHTPENERTYREHPDALRGVDPAAKLRAWGRQLGARVDLGDQFAQGLIALEQAEMATWQRHVSGKYVLRELHRRLPRLPGAGQFALSHYLNLYLRECPEPPADLSDLVGRILGAAGR